MLKKIFIVSHYNYTTGAPIHGPLHSIQDYLEKTRRSYFSLYHPLYTGNVSYFRVWKGNNPQESTFGSKVKFPLPIKSLFEVITTTYYGMRVRPYLYVGIDPLNALPGVFLKSMGFVKKLVFYTADYADLRFANKIFNGVYFFIDKVARESSDYVWNVSSRILNKRIKQGIPRDKLILLLNSPDVEQVNPAPLKEVVRNNIIMVSGVTHSKTFDETIAAFGLLVRDFPDAKLLIAGTGPYEEELKKEVKKLNLSNSVEFKGQLPHSELVALIKKCGLGIALYTSDFAWTKYGDSMKAREYLAAGVPVIITQALSTADDIEKEKVGLVVRLDRKEIFEAAKKILLDKKIYLKMREKARKLALRTDFATNLESALQKVEA